MTTSRIRRYILHEAKGRIFVTRMLLNFGTRDAVDKALSRLVASGFIKRLSRGVFIAADSKEKPTTEEIAHIKARTFGKSILIHGRDAARQLGLTKKGNRQPTYCTTGATSSFRTIDTVVHFRSVARRKMLLGNSIPGLTVRALWTLGKKRVKRLVPWLNKSFDLWTRDDEKSLFNYVEWLPEWMTGYFAWLTVAAGASRLQWNELHLPISAESA